MNKFEIETIKRAFARCHGLQSAFIDHADTNKEVINSLAYQTGMRPEFITTHKEQIKKL